MNRLQLIKNASKRVKSEKQQQSLKLSDLFRQVAILSDREYTSKKDVDSVRELMF